MNNTSAQKNKEKSSKISNYAGLIVFLLTGIVFSIHFSPSLYYDDWNHFAYNFYKGTLPWFMPDFIRPLTYFPLRLETSLVGMNLPVLTVIHITLLALEAFLFYLLLEKLRLFPTILNALAALLIIFSPMDMTRMWLLISPGMMICVLIYMLSLVHFIEKQNWLVFVAGLIVGFVTLLYYEIQLGLMIIFPAALFLLTRIRQRKNEWWMLFPIFLGIDYLVFRMLGISMGGASFHTSQSITMIYILRQVRNALLCLFNAWYLPVKTDIVIGLIAIWSTVFAVLFVAYQYVRSGFEKDVRSKFLKAACIFMSGIFIWLAGYIPWLAYGIPSIMDWFSSRAHNTAIPGTVICLCALLYFLAEIPRVSPSRKQGLMIALAIPFLLTGALSQTTLQYENKLLWNDYRKMWNGFFAAVPNIKNDTHVVLVISPNPEKPRFGEREFLTSASFNVEISRALNIFYANNTLEGEFMYKHMELPDTPVMTDHGIRNPPTYSGAIPYDEILFIEFDRVSGKVKVIRDLRNEFGIPDPAYNADRHIDNRPLDKPTLRYIVQ
ncbi:MAG: hypothetical protein GYA15_05145 [Leptolinea sp.]|jgi:hypothetical protein|nr:hypothetical protein [Leptolinea sp.]